MKLTTLRKRAATACKWRGHRMRWELDANGARGRGACQADGCTALVFLTTRPAPNDIDIGGTAVALNCPAVERAAHRGRS